MDHRDIFTTCLAIGTVGLIGFVITAVLQYKQRNKTQYLLLIGSLLCEIIATFILVRLMPTTNLLSVFFTIQGLVVCLCGLSIVFIQLKGKQKTQNFTNFVLLFGIFLLTHGIIHIIFSLFPETSAPSFEWLVELIVFAVLSTVTIGLIGLFYRRFKRKDNIKSVSTNQAK